MSYSATVADELFFDRLLDGLSIDQRAAVERVLRARRIHVKNDPWSEPETEVKEARESGYAKGYRNGVRDEAARHEQPEQQPPAAA